MYIKDTKIPRVLYKVQTQFKPNTTLLFLLAENSQYDIPELIEGLNLLNINFIGGVFPGLIYGDQRHEKGMIVKTMDAQYSFLCQPWSDDDVRSADLDSFITNHLEPHSTALILMDGLTEHKQDILTGLYQRLGNQVQYVGAGAGSLSLKQQPCIFDKHGVYQDAAVISFIRSKVGLGVKHGWEELDGPLVATEVEHQVIKELNWKPAFEVYKEVVEHDTSRRFSEGAFFDLAKSYPFSQFKKGVENIVRDPISVDEQGNIACLGEIPENAILNILKGCPDSLVMAAQQAAQDSLNSYGPAFKDSLIINCISRVLFLEEDFKRELAAISEILTPPTGSHTAEGVLSLGEVSFLGRGYLEFLNKTVVVTAIYDRKIKSGGS